MGGKVLVPAQEFVQKLVAARLAADILGVPTVLIARTDADSASCSPVTATARPWSSLTGERTKKGSWLQRRPGRGDCPRPDLRSLRRHDLVRDLRAESGRSAALC